MLYSPISDLPEGNFNPLIPPRMTINLLSSGMAFAKLYALTLDEENFFFESDQL
jgi:hypothetical protein